MALFGKKQNTDETTSSTQAPAKTGAGSAPKHTISGGKVAAQVLLRPRVTEKATLQNDQNTYVFEVPQEVTKRDVKAAVYELFKVVPKSVTIVRMRPQTYEARMRRRKGQKSGFKKAYVHLKKGETMDVMK